MTDPQPDLPDPRTADDEDATPGGQSTTAPAEGGDDTEPRNTGSPQA